MNFHSSAKGYQMLYSPSSNGFFCREVHGDAMPADAVPVVDSLYQSLAGNPIAPDADGLPSLVVAQVTPESLVSANTTALQNAMDAAAKTIGYDDIKTAITYRGDANEEFAADAEGFFRWRSDVWTAAYAYVARVKLGEVPMPTPADAVSMMPIIPDETLRNKIDALKTI
jgi:hypothetical protein